MKILKVIHGYPFRFNAGSEVYSQTLCHALSKEHEMCVFTREEDPFTADYRLREETDPDHPGIRVFLVNNPRNRDRYRVDTIDQRMAEVLDDFQPEVVHIGHLNHLSTSLVQVVAEREIPIVFTLHDFWLMCPRGQFMQMFPEDTEDVWAVCDGQDDRKCAMRCYSRYFGGEAENAKHDTNYWTGWVHQRMQHVREMLELVDLFIAPSRYLYARYRDEFGLPEAKLRYLDYGFPRDRLSGRMRLPDGVFTFGYIGTHIPAKGIHLLIQAFGKIRGNARLRIWGRELMQETDALKRLAQGLSSEEARRIEWYPEYRNQEIVLDVFNKVDAIVVPSIWAENSPLVIHEAQQAQVPVITADLGGMCEFVHHENNGLLFEHRSVESLATQLQRMVDEPELAGRLGARGYLYSDSGDVPDIVDHANAIEGIYRELIARRDSTKLERHNGPWRITFDTNPDTCNMHCIMCEEHSPYSDLQKKRVADGQPRRIMPFDLIERVVAEAAQNGLREIIPSTMGEPLLYEHFEGILELCSRHGVKLNLTTNGTFPRLGAEAWAQKIVPVTSDVKISWNGATKETHEKIMQGSAWEKVLENTRLFIAVRDTHAQAGGNRCRVTFQLTFLETNLAELPDIVRLAVRLGVDRVKGHHLWAHFDEIENLSMRRSREAILRWNEAVDKARQVASESLLPNGECVLLDNIFPLDPDASDEIAPGGQCPFLGQEVWVSAMGRFDPCCAPDAQRRTLGEFGNFKDQSLTEIWNGPRYRKLLATYRNRQLCRGCNMRRPAS